MPDPTPDAPDQDPEPAAPRHAGSGAAGVGAAGARDFDVVVVGGGHAGAEAALAAARLGARTACVVLDPDAIGRMSCNPAIGGLAKGQLVREVDALGGEMGLATDAAGIQFRILNTRKGPAVRSPRAQCDRDVYNAFMSRAVQTCRGLTVVRGEAVDLCVSGSGPARHITGVALADGGTLHAPVVVLTTGTFLGGLLFAGEWERAGGRLGEGGATRIARALAGLGLRLGRHKTGTPPRLVMDSIDFEGLQEQPGDPEPRPFSFRTEPRPWRANLRQLPCWITRTTDATHRIIAENAHRSPMYRGAPRGTGPRYCPSVEDKVMRFRDKDSHQVFLEPETRGGSTIYPNGLSTSLPPEVQLEFLRTIPGLQRVEIAKQGYAVEYDHLVTDQIRADLSVAGVKGLFAAGQINGTSGYEEAAGQGIIAGINAVRFARGGAPFVLDRADGYIGVMVDDLCRVQPAEPYRMFTSRAEFRLLLRSDNADRRLTPIGVELGLLDAAQGERVAAKEARIAQVRGALRGARRGERSLEELLRRPEVTLTELVPELPEDAAATATAHPDAAAEVEAEVKYEGYIERQQREVARLRRMEQKRIPPGFDFSALSGVSHEARERWQARQPLTVGEASRVAGARQSDVQVLLVALARG